MLPDAKVLQIHPKRCDCETGFKPSKNPRKNGRCLQCGMVPPRPLPEHVEELFEVLAEVAEGAGVKSRSPVTDPDFESFRSWTMTRVHWGQREHGEGWRGRHMPREATEELLDCVVYSFAQMVKDGERSADLFEAALHVYRAFVAFRRYEARQKGSA